MCVLQWHTKYVINKICVQTQNCPYYFTFLLKVLDFYFKVKGVEQELDEEEEEAAALK